MRTLTALVFFLVCVAVVAQEQQQRDGFMKICEGVDPATRGKVWMTGADGVPCWGLLVEATPVQQQEANCHEQDGRWCCDKIMGEITCKDGSPAVEKFEGKEHLTGEWISECPGHKGSPLHRAMGCPKPRLPPGNPNCHDKNSVWCCDDKAGVLTDRQGNYFMFRAGIANPVIDCAAVPDDAIDMSYLLPEPDKELGFFDALLSLVFLALEGTMVTVLVSSFCWIPICCDCYVERSIDRARADQRAADMSAFSARLALEPTGDLALINEAFEVLTAEGRDSVHSVRQLLDLLKQAAERKVALVAQAKEARKFK